MDLLTTQRDETGRLRHEAGEFVDVDLAVAVGVAPVGENLVGSGDPPVVLAEGVEGLDDDLDLGALAAGMVPVPSSNST